MKPSKLFNYGNCTRDFTYIDDIMEGVKRIMQGTPERKTGDVPVIYADTEPLERDYGFHPSTPLGEGLRKFGRWYK